MIAVESVVVVVAKACPSPLSPTVVRSVAPNYIKRIAVEIVKVFIVLIYLNLIIYIIDEYKDSSYQLRGSMQQKFVNETM